jgi:hypothetical protein|tara:strand:+ start:250 stop:504 length:255 start_codon:yes stop_codon:yes gene_type:complete
MNSTADKFVKGIYSEYVGKRSQVLAEIEVYLNSPVGVGEHSKISVEIKNRLEELAQVDDVVNTIEKHFDVKPTIPELNEDQTGE